MSCSSAGPWKSYRRLPWRLVSDPRGQEGCLWSPLSQLCPRPAWRCPISIPASVLRSLGRWSSLRALFTSLSVGCQGDISSPGILRAQLRHFCDSGSSSPESDPPTPPLPLEAGSVCAPRSTRRRRSLQGVRCVRICPRAAGCGRTLGSPRGQHYAPTFHYADHRPPPKRSVNSNRSSAFQVFVSESLVINLIINILLHSGE